MKYKAVIFDLDGTLVNSIYDIADAMNMVLSERNYRTYDYETYKTFVGLGLKKLVIRAIPDSALKTSLVDKCLIQMMDIYSKRCTNKTQPYPGILELLEQLKSKNIKLGILSNKEDSLTKKVASTLLPDYLYPTVGLKDETLKKPNPKILLEICKELNIKPAEAIYVGDSNIDIQVAKNAKIYAVGVSWGFRNKKELIEQGADLVIDKPSDLLAVL